MISTLHEGLVSLFRDDPELIVDLVAGGFGVCLTPKPELLVDRHADFAVDARRRLSVNSRSADLVLVIEDPEHPDGGVAIIVEVQLSDDAQKRRRIAGYLGLLVDRHDLPVHVGTVALREGVARNLASWTVGTALRVDTFVLDRRSVPRVTSLVEARKRPTLAILSGAVHGFHGDLEVAWIALTAAQELEPRVRQRYTATVLAALSEENRTMFMQALPENEEVELSDLERETGTYLAGVKEGREEGRRQVLAESVLGFVELRGLGLSAEQVARVRGASLEQLERWFVQVRRVESAAELFVAG